MISKKILSLAPLIVSASVASAQPVSEQSLRAHIEILASDAFEGRLPGTAGGERTEAYLVDAFAKAGLKPGTIDGRWRQIVRIVERKPGDSVASFTSRRGPVAAPRDPLIMMGPQAAMRIADAPMVFGGYGLPASFEGVDLTNKVVLRLSGSPAGMKNSPSDDDRASAMFAKGAAAVVTILALDAPWDAVKGSWQEAKLDAPAGGPSGVRGLISQAAAEQLLRSGGGDLAKLKDAAAKEGFRATPLDLRATVDVRTAVRSVETANIVGKIEGATRPNEAVVLLAHWDHLGICRPEGAPDRICNGAVDNGSGTAILIEAARQLASGARPGRTIYILATTAEEMGLLGAEAFAAAPPVPATSIVAALNLDTTALGPAGLPVAIIGRGKHPRLEEVVDAVSLSLGRKVDVDEEANVMVTRQDGWAFGARGIPSIMVTGSVSDMGRLQAYLRGPYHKPEDDIAHATELGGAAEDATLNIAVARALADPRKYSTP